MKDYLKDSVEETVEVHRHFVEHEGLDPKIAALLTIAAMISANLDAILTNMPEGS